MSIRILKYPIVTFPKGVIEVPFLSIIRKVGFQKLHTGEDIPYAWIESDRDEERKTKLSLRFIPTGASFDTDGGWEFFDTIFCTDEHGDPEVWHVFTSTFAHVM